MIIDQSTFARKYAQYQHIKANLLVNQWIYGKNEKNTIQKILESIDNSLKANSNYCALIATLALPDICGKIEYKDKKSKDRYVYWFNKYLYEKYNRRGYNNKIDFLVAENCYALRCSLLHEGNTDIEKQKIQQGSLNKIHFHANEYDEGHCNLNCDNIEGLQLNVLRFCQDVMEGVNNWLNDIKNEGEKIKKCISRQCSGFYYAASPLRKTADFRVAVSPSKTHG